MNQIKQDITLLFISNIKSNNAIKTVRLDDVACDIKRGEYKSIIDDIRSCSCKERRTNLKFKLPAFVSGVQLTDNRCVYDNEIYTTTGIVQFDIDNISIAEAEAFKGVAKKRPECLMCFISPSGGLKIFLSTDYKKTDTGHTLKSEYQHVYAKAKEYLSQFLSVKFDDSLKNISQPCYVSYDDSLYLNLDAKPLKVKDEAIKRSAQQTKTLPSKSYNNSLSVAQITELLSFIPKNLSYNERVKVNFAVIAASPTQALDTLLNHWQVDDKDKLKRDLQTQIKAFTNGDSSVSVGTLFHCAKENGFKHFNVNAKSSAVSKGLDPTYNQKIFSLDDGLNKLHSLINEYFTTRESMTIKCEAGAGKTKQIIVEVVDYLIDNPHLKFLILVPRHNLADEIENRISEELKKRVGNAKIFKEKLNSLQNVRVKHIKGRKQTDENGDYLCQNSINTSRDMVKSPEDRAVLEDFDENARNHCINCSLKEHCAYIEQFNGHMNNIRIATHEQYYNKPSIFDGGHGRLHSSEDIIDFLNDNNTEPFKPDFIIIDEDPIRKAIDNHDNIHSLKVGDFAKSPKINSTIRNVIHELANNNDSFQRVILNHADDLKRASRIQEEDLNNWRNGSFANLLQRKKNKPHYSIVIDKMVEYIDLMQSNSAYIEGTYHKLCYDNDETRFLDYKKPNDIYREAPVLILDAGANETISKKYFGNNHRFEQISIQYQSNVTITQYEGKEFSKNQISKTPEQKQLVNYINNFDLSGKTGLISYHKILKDISSQINHDDKGYFNNLTGLDSFKSFDNLIVIGRHCIPVYSLEDKYRQIFGDVTVNNQELCTDIHFVDKTYRMADGEHKTTIQREYVNAQMNELDEFYNKSETYQAIHRLRLIHESQKKNVIFFSSQVLDITVDNLLKTSSELGYKDTKTVERIEEIVSAIQLRGILENKSAAIVKNSTLTTQQVNNLKKDPAFVERVLKLDDKINHITIDGVDNNRRKITKTAFVYDNYNQNQLMTKLNLKTITSIS